MTWSSRPCTPADHDAVLGFFTEPDFYFRSPHPDLLSEAEVLNRLNGARLLLFDGAPVGLYAVQSAGEPHCHYVVHLRLARDVPDQRWVEAYQEIVRALRWRTEVVRVTVWAGDPDTRWLRLLRDMGLTEEGVLDGLVVHRGARHGLRQFAQVWR